jgi:hypothetical protein
MKELDFLLKPEYIDNYINQKPFKLEEKIPFDVTWDELLTLIEEDFNYAIENNLEYNEGWKRADNPWHKYAKSGYGFKLFNTERIKAVETIKNTLLTIFDPCTFEGEIQSIPSFITFATNKLLGNTIHYDPTNIFCWQVRGKAEWSMYNNETEEIEYTFLLEEGDMVFCPFKKKHSVLPKSPRAGISFGLGHLKSDKIGIL